MGNEITDSSYQSALNDIYSGTYSGQALEELKSSIIAYERIKFPILTIGPDNVKFFEKTLDIVSVFVKLSEIVGKLDDQENPLADEIRDSVLDPIWSSLNDKQIEFLNSFK